MTTGAFVLKCRPLCFAVCALCRFHCPLCQWRPAPCEEVVVVRFVRSFVRFLWMGPSARVFLPPPRFVNTFDSAHGAHGAGVDVVAVEELAPAAHDDLLAIGRPACAQNRKIGKVRALDARVLETVDL